MKQILANWKTTMRFASSSSTAASTRDATVEVCDDIKVQMGSDVDLACLFVSPHHADSLEELVSEIRRRLNVAHLVGCTAVGVITNDQEIEDEPGISLWCSQLPNTTIELMHLRLEKTPDGMVFVGWPEVMIDEWPQSTVLLTVSEPFSFPMDSLLQRIDDDHPGTKVVGGVASSSHEPGGNRLIFEDKVLDEGAVIVALSGDVAMETVVSQGCRPIGDPMVITKAERNEVFELRGKPALSQLIAMFDLLPTREKRLVQQGVYLGRVVNEYQDSFQMGDFLIRNVTAMDRETGCLTVAEYMRAGQTVQFHIRDEETADNEMELLLLGLKSKESFDAQAGLLFSCNGRGSNFFSNPHHDAQLLRRTLGEIPVGGFFAAGEIGPIGDKNFMHGYTASILLFGK